MPIQPISGIMNKAVQQPLKIEQTPFEAQQKFSAVLNEAISRVDQTQKISDTATAKLVRGEDVDLHNVMIAAQKANIALSATVEVRNKVVEAYQEIIRMPV